MTDNLRAAMWRANDNPKAAILYFQAREQKESIAFRITTSAPILSSFWEAPFLRGGHWLNQVESRSVYHYAIALDEHKFLDQPFIVGLEIEADGDPQDSVVGATVWDKTDGEPQIIYIEFPTA